MFSNTSAHYQTEDIDWSPDNAHYVTDGLFCFVDTILNAERECTNQYVYIHRLYSTVRNKLVKLCLKMKRTITWHLICTIVFITFIQFNVCIEPFCTTVLIPNTANLIEPLKHYGKHQYTKHIWLFNGAFLFICKLI